jgi:hypothetical protein
VFWNLLMGECKSFNYNCKIDHELSSLFWSSIRFFLSACFKLQAESAEILDFTVDFCVRIKASLKCSSNAFSYFCLKTSISDMKLILIALVLILSTVALAQYEDDYSWGPPIPYGAEKCGNTYCAREERCLCNMNGCYCYYVQGNVNELFIKSSGLL